MSETITLAHVSDVHLSPLPGVALRHLNVKRGLGYINWQRQRRRTHHRAVLDLVMSDMLAHKPDHIAITGDLINLGLPAEYEAATAWLHEVGTPHHVTVVPGNHDIYSALRGDPGVELWADYMRADAFGAKFDSRPSMRFPFVRRVGPVALIGLNSAVETPPFVAAVGARLAIVSAAHANRWGFPRPEVRERWEHSGAAMTFTGDSGAVTVDFGPAGVAVSTQRDVRHRYWHAPRFSW